LEGEEDQGTGRGREDLWEACVLFGLTRP
jgi:hypothetical protein